MNFQEKTRISYKSELTLLSVLTLLFGFCCLFFGYLTLPLAAGFYAALLLLEKKENRFFSFVIPLIPLVVNVFINGFYSLEAIGYVAIGAVIFAGFERKKNKAATVFMATALLLVMMIFSLALLAIDQLGTLKIAELSDFYTDLYESGKTKIIGILTSFTSVDEEGFVFYNINPSDAVDMYNAFVLSLIPVTIIFALILVGITARIFASRTKRYDDQYEEINNWRFITSPFLAYAYIAILALASLSSAGIVGVSLTFVSTILMSVYFYIGICVVFAFVSSKKGNVFAFFVIFAALVVFNSFAPQIISFIGVYVNNTVYKNQNASDINV